MAMAKNTGTIDECLTMTIHHVGPHKAGLMSGGDSSIPTGAVRSRFQLVTDNLTAAQETLRAVREALESGNLSGALEALNQQIEFGHNI